MERDLYSLLADMAPASFAQRQPERPTTTLTASIETVDNDRYASIFGIFGP